MTMMLGISLTGRRVLLVGGGAVAARRLERFLDEGAVVHIVAPRIVPEIELLVHAHGLEWSAREFRAEDVAGAWLVHTATGVAAVDAAVAALCESVQVLCIDAGDGPRGSARMTATTAIGDVMIGVCSVSGVDPRRAMRVRDTIAAVIDEGGVPVRRRRAGGQGRVDLVGGGPGPADLMTVRARRLLAEADVVVADRLGPASEVRALLDRDVLVIDVGKTPGNHPVPQETINDLLVAHALAGRRVVRLKGGDPFVFGRGGEEVRACRAAGVAVDVTPGISSAIAVPQAAGVPVTHRGTAAAVHIVNGHGGLTSASLAALRDPETTTVVLMGVSALPGIVAQARAHGIDDALPVAIVERGHTADQRTTRSTLRAVVDDAAAAGIRNPAVIVLGDVAAADLLLPSVTEAAAR